MRTRFSILRLKTKVSSDMEVVTSYGSGHLFGRSLLLASLNDLAAARGEVDAVITEASWDPRCLGLCKAEGIFGSGCIIAPGELRKSARSEHLTVLDRWLRGHADSVSVVSAKSGSVRSTLSEVTDWLDGLYASVGRPLTVLMDLNALARYYSLGVLSHTHSRGMVERWLFLYEEGAYGDDAGIVWEAPRTTWAAHAIPGMEGDWYPTREQLFLVSLGFDGDRVAQLIDRQDPAKVVALLGEPGVRPEYPHKSLEVNRTWMQRTETEIVARAHAADAVAAWSLVEKWLLELRHGYNPQGLLCGSKPHSLGVAIAALSTEELGLVYLTPSAEVQQRILPLGRYWLYELTDIAVGSGRSS